MIVGYYALAAMALLLSIVSIVMWVIEYTKDETNAKGDAGVKDDTGAKVETCEKGTQGTKGETGAKGDSGAKGDAGTKGDAGANGEKGEAGAKGETGAKSETGSNGIAGAQGEKGEVGTKGDAGVKGNTGAKGDAGVKGDAGAKGEQGEAGTKGDVGTTGTNDKATIDTMLEDIARLQIRIVKPVLSLNTTLRTQIDVTIDSDFNISEYVSIDDIDVNLEKKEYTTDIINTRDADNLQEYKIVYTVTTVYGQTAFRVRTLTVKDITIPKIGIHKANQIISIGNTFTVWTSNLDVREEYLIEYKINDGFWINGSKGTILKAVSGTTYTIIYRATYAVNGNSTEVTETVEFVQPV